MSRSICIALILAFSVIHPSRTSGDFMLEVTEDGDGGSEYSFSVTGLGALPTRELLGSPFRTFRVVANSTEFSMLIETHTILSTAPITREFFKLRFPAR